MSKPEFFVSSHTSLKWGCRASAQVIARLAEEGGGIAILSDLFMSRSFCDKPQSDSFQNLRHASALWEGTSYTPHKCLL